MSSARRVGDDKHYAHVQNASASVWTITHELEKYPSVTVSDSAGNTVVGDVKYISVNQLTVTFSTPFSGSAFCN